MKQQYLRLAPGDVIECSIVWDSPDAGPCYPLPPGDEGSRWIPVDFEFSRAGRRDTEVATLVDGAVVWTETASLDDVIAEALDRIDDTTEAARLKVIARQTNTPEYERAEVQARAFKTAGYPEGDVPRTVAGWANAKWRDGWTAQQAADDIIATADRWYGLLEDIRDLRLCTKEDVRHAADSGEVAARVQQFTTDLTVLMKGVL